MQGKIPDRVTVVIPNYNGKKYLRTCLESLAAQTCPVPVIVVDNGSGDGSAETAERFSREAEGGLRVRVIRLERNTGFANAVNEGIRACRTPYVVLLNNDTAAEPRMVERLYLAISKRPDVFSVGAKLLEMKKPHRIDNCGDLYCALGWAFSPGRDCDRTAYSKRAYVTSACAGAAIYQRKIFSEIGWFDEAHFCYLEDVDIGYRARLRGYRNMYEPSAIVYHAGSASSGSRYNAFKERLSAGNNLYLLYKNMPPLQLFINLPLLLAGTCIKLIFFARRGLGGAYLLGLKDGLGKIAAHPDRRLPFRMKYLPQYLSLQCELWRNCIRRAAG